MRCEDVLDVLRAASASDDARGDALDHLATCDDCRAAAQAVAALRADGQRAIRAPSDDALTRAVARAARFRERPASVRGNRFWTGVAVGGALAAGIAIAVVAFTPALRGTVPAAVPAITVALDEVRDVKLALDSPQPLDDAAIRVVLSGPIALDGYGAQREIAWSTHLAQGVNELTLPIVASAPGGGQLLVEVRSGERRRTFVVDVRAVPDRGGPAAAVPAAAKPLFG